MFKNTEVNYQLHRYEQPKVKEEVEATLRKLQLLRNRISELRVQCEELRRLSSETKEGILLCNECGKAVDPSEEIVIKGSDGIETAHYHKECFKLLWV
jgi:hypothetical protein